MAEVDDLGRIQRAHHAQLLAIRSTTAGLVEDAWDAYAGLDDRAAREFVSAATAIVDGAKMQTAVSAAAYLEANDAILGIATEISPGMPVTRNGVPTSTVYERSIVQSRRMVGNGTPVDTAMNAGKSRAASTARTDVIDANRQSIADMQRSHVVGYRRVLTGKSCAFCATISTRRYKKANLQPVHANCDCDVAEIYGDVDPGEVLNRQLLDELKSSSGRPDYWNDRSYIVGDDGGIYRSKTIFVRDPETGNRLLNANGNPVRRIEAGEPLKVAVKEHGELGRVVTDSRHAFTAADDVADIELPDPPAGGRSSVRVADDVVEEVLEEVDEIPAKVVEEALEESPPPRIKKTDPESPSVRREAERRSVAPEVVAQERDAKKLRTALERRAAKEYESSLSVDHPDVIRVAETNGVSPEEVMLARARVADVRAEIRNVAAEIQAEQFDRLYRWNDVKMKGPGSYDDLPAEFDWFRGLDAREKARLSRKWFDASDTASAPDELAQILQAADGSLASLDFEDVIEEWLDVTRRYEMAGAARRGKLPSSRAYSDALDLDDVLGDRLPSGLSPRRILSSDDLEAAGHIASSDRVEMAEDAFQMLGDATRAPNGSRPYEMSFQRWEEEVRTLEYGLREFPAEMPRGSADRLQQLVPRFIDEPGLDYEELYARIVTTARTAGEEVPSYARIPWE